MFLDKKRAEIFFDKKDFNQGRVLIRECYSLQQIQRDGILKKVYTPSYG